MAWLVVDAETAQKKRRGDAEEASARSSPSVDDNGVEEDGGARGTAPPSVVSARERSRRLDVGVGAPPGAGPRRS